MEDGITTIIEEGRYNGLASHIVAEQVLEYTKSIEKEDEKYEGISRHVETLYIKGVSNCCDTKNEMKEPIEIEIEISERMTAYYAKLAIENEELKDKLSDIERYILLESTGSKVSSSGWLKGYCRAMAIIHENFFKKPEQKQATDIIENANEELLKELKKQLL